MGEAKRRAQAGERMGPSEREKKYALEMELWRMERQRKRFAREERWREANRRKVGSKEVRNG